jgi:hypothetical protein
MILQAVLLVSVIGNAVQGYLVHKQSVRHAKALAASKVETANAAAGIKAPDKIKQDVEGVLNTIRADETLLTTHAYQIVSRIRAELRKVL